MTTTLELPADTAPSRLNRVPRSETPDDVTSAGERIAAFWEKYPDGSILPEVEADEIPDGSGGVYRVYTAKAFIRKHGDSERPDAVAHATRGENDPDEVTAQFPQETAETSAISRALRNLGILPNGKLSDRSAPTPSSADAAPAVHPLAVARKSKSWSQKTLAVAMAQRGHDWSQAVVSKVENGHRELRDEEIAALTELVGYRGES